MLLQIVLVAAALRTVVAWPITPLDGYSRTDTHHLSLKCGDDIEFREPTFTNLNVTFSDVDDNGNIEADCSVKLRIAIEDLDIYKYGIHVAGAVDVNDNSNGDSCQSSYLSLADEDDLEDELGTLEKYCNEETIAFKTTEDMLVIELVVGKNGASGKGFQLNISPHYLCGGQVDVEKTISTPDYPWSYPRDITCLWRVQAPEGHHIALKCSKFDLKEKKRGKCVDYLMLIGDSVPTQYCGKELEGVEVEFQTNVLIMDFRTSKPMNDNKGFRCKPKFKAVRKTKELLLAKFFK